MLAEWTNGADWSDYIYANGKRIARGDNYADRILVQGANCAGCNGRVPHAIGRPGARHD